MSDRLDRGDKNDETSTDVDWTSRSEHTRKRSSD
jgi:hypothetical protein